MNKLPSLDLEFSENLATTQIIALGNLIGDILWMLEVEMIKKGSVASVNGGRVELGKVRFQAL